MSCARRAALLASAAMAEETLWSGTSSQLKNLGIYLLCILVIPIPWAIARWLAPGGVAVVTEFGDQASWPKLSTHLDHPELSTHFGQLAQAAAVLLVVEVAVLAGVGVGCNTCCAGVDPGGCVATGDGVLAGDAVVAWIRSAV